MPEVAFLEGLIVPLSIFLVTLVIGYGVRLGLYRLLDHWAKRTTTQVDDIIIAATRLPSLLWILILSALIARQALPIHEQFAGIIDKFLVAVLILSLTLVMARLLSALVHHFSSRLPEGTTLPMTGLTHALTQGLVLVIGILILLSTLGINITPLLTALGIGGLAVALALQDTLSNFFAGLHILLARQIHIGQRIKLDSGEEGYVADIGWRSTTLRTPPNHLVIIPNAKLAQTIVTNYNMPDPPVNIVIPVGVSYDANPEEVREVLRDEVCRMIDEVPGFIKEFDPIVRFQSMGEFSLNFLVILRVENFDTQFGVWDEINQRIFKRLKRERIEIPFPVRTVYLKNGLTGSTEAAERR